MNLRILLFPVLLSGAFAAAGHQPFYDRAHPSEVFGEQRNYRIFLPSDYGSSERFYPVVYYFHGHSDRYTLERYDDGLDTAPRIAAFVAGHPLIVVSVDGFVARDYTGFYGGNPWDVRDWGGDFDFGPYFKELIDHVDTTYRTLTDRRHRGISGLSMGGFMSLYLSARYPELIGSASSFNPGTEFFTGEPGRRMLWRPKDHVACHRHTMVRLIRASGDYISQYHEETREAYARDHRVRFEFRQDEYHRHWATSIEETLAFHLRAFDSPALNNVPERWDYANAYASFEAWGYQVQIEPQSPALTYLEDVRQGGLRIRTRRWAPDGPPAADNQITLTTAALYRPGEAYDLLDYSLNRGKLERKTVTADANGRISFTVDGSGHQISFAGPGTGAEPPVLLPVTERDVLRLQPGSAITLPLSIYNPRGVEIADVGLELTSDYPTVEIVRGETALPALQSGGVAGLDFQVRLTAGMGYFAPARLELRMVYDGWYEFRENIPILITPERLPAPLQLEILDGRTMDFAAFRQAGNQGGGAPVRREVTEGRGNGNGILEPGEQATFWLKLEQGLDPFDKGNWYRCKVYSDSPWLTEIGDLQESKQREWTGSHERTSLVELSREAPAGTRIPLILDNESWSFHFTPDVRYGAEPLYQAFQLHRRHLHQYEVAIP